jgi:hypothetical protein
MTKLFLRLPLGTGHRKPWAAVLLTAIAATLWCSGTVLAQSVPPAGPADISELRFADFFQTPLGPKGAQTTPVLLQADGKTVRLVGYMVQQERPTLGHFMLTPRPVRMSEHADGDADDLPIAWAMVYLDPSQSDFVVPYVRGRIEVQGTVSVGRLEEQDGRVSWVRLQLAPEATRGMNSFEVANHLHTLQHIH